MNFTLINNIFIYILLTILLCCVIVLFTKINKLISNNNIDIPDNLTLESLKVNNLEVEDKLISPNIITENITSNNDKYKKIKINDFLSVSKGIYTPDLTTDGYTNNVIAKFNNLLVDNGYIKQFKNEDTISYEDYINKVKSDKEKYKQEHNI